MLVVSLVSLVLAILMVGYRTAHHITPQHNNRCCRQWPVRSHTAAARATATVNCCHSLLLSRPAVSCIWCCTTLTDQVRVRSGRGGSFWREVECVVRSMQRTHSRPQQRNERRAVLGLCVLAGACRAHTPRQPAVALHLCVFLLLLVVVVDAFRAAFS